MYLYTYFTLWGLKSINNQYVLRKNEIRNKSLFKGSIWKPSVNTKCIQGLPDNIGSKCEQALCRNEHFHALSAINFSKLLADQVSILRQY